MTTYYIIPGLGNSGEQHWQTWMEHSSINFRRIDQVEWDAPVCSEWINTIQQALEKEDLASTVLVGHSLGCATIVHWAHQFGKSVKGALLVAPSDPEADAYNFPATGFSPLPLMKIPFKTIVVASTNDPWVTLERAKFFADSWDSDFINIGAAGHINVASGHYEWNFGLDLLKTYFE